MGIAGKQQETQEQEFKEQVPMSDAESQFLLRDVAAGDAQAERELFARYARRMQALAAKKLSGRASARADAEDVTQSALCCFFAGAREDRWRYEVPGDLWRLLAGIVVNKCRAHIRRNLTARRDVRREQATPIDDGANAQAAENADAPSAQVRLWEAASVVIASLQEEEHRLLQFKLNGETTPVIAQLLQLSERSARRKLAQLEEKLQRLLLQSQTANAPDQDGAPNDNRAMAALTDDGVQQRIKDLQQVVGEIAYDDLLLEQLVGAGGIGKVFRAVRRSTGEVLAVKALAKKHHRNAAAVAAFLNEAAILAELRHPRIVPARGLGQFPSGGLFLAMDFVRGEDLGQRLPRGPLSSAEALDVITQIAEALVAAHERGIVHCDLKPANILLSKDGRVLVADFGFAQLIADRMSNARQIPVQAVAGGTPGFAAPEQWSQSPGSAQLAATVDIYALGKLLLAMLNGVAPTLHDQSLAIAAEIPGALGEVCRRCLQTTPSQRYASAREFLRAAQQAACA